MHIHTIVAAAVLATAAGAAGQDRVPQAPRTDATQSVIRKTAFVERTSAKAASRVQLPELGNHARTPAEHQQVAEQYAAFARKQMRVADRHAVVAQSYRSQDIRTGGAGTAILYDQLARQSRELATEARAEAARHRRLAQVGQT